MKISDTNLSNRSKNVLNENGIITLKDLINRDTLEIKSFKNLGSTSLQEINEVIGLIKNGSLIVYENEKFDFENKYFLKHLINSYEGEFLTKYIIETLFKIIDDTNGISRNDLSIYLPQELELDVYLRELFSLHKITIFNDIIKVRMLTIEEYLIICNIKNCEIFRKRLEGNTLDEIGKNHSLTRERIRQIIYNINNSMPTICEDEFKYIYNTYSLEKNVMTELCGISAYGYYYLKSKYKKGNKDIDNMIDDINIPNTIRKKALSITHREDLILKGSFVKRDKHAIINYIVRNECQSLTPIQEIYDSYLKIVKENNLNDIQYNYDFRTFNNYLDRSDICISSFRKKVRYYNTDIEIANLIEDLNLDTVNNIELSSKYLFENYETTMKLFDINDEYELHNLLKKNSNKIHEIDLHFGRSPMLILGVADRERQVRDLLYELAPVNEEEFINEYKQRYGGQPATIKANFLKYINCFLVDGIFKIDLSINPYELNELKELLDKDIYKISEIRKIYLSHFPNGKSKVSNVSFLKQLGFTVTKEIVYKNKYKSSIDFLYSLIDSESTIDLSDYKWIFSNSTFSASLYRLLSNYEIIELERYIFACSSKIDNLSSDKINNFCNKLAKQAGDKCFTIKSIMNDEDRLGEYSDYFYFGLLKNDSRINYINTKNYSLMKFSDRPISTTTLIEELMKEKKKFNFDKLINFILEEYGIIIEKYDLRKFISNLNYYYLPTLNKVYIDYNSMMEDLE
jgi:hypothetical protein